LRPVHAQMVELVDTRVSKTRIARCAGSTPALGTKKNKKPFSFRERLFI
jgi:hypothetical protein